MKQEDKMKYLPVIRFIRILITYMYVKAII